MLWLIRVIDTAKLKAV